MDDEPFVLMGICRNLRGHRDEWEPLLAIDADEACMRLDATPDIDVLVCDLAMPGGGGLRVLRYALEKHPHVTRVVLSGNPRGEVADEARQLCHRFLEKPCPAQTLEETLRWAIALRSAGS